jgi:serine/threonine protein kinase
MCQIKYKKVAKILKTGDIEINKPKSCPVIPTAEAGTIKDDSDTSSVILTWLNSLPNEGLIPPPKFSDFEYIGCLGQGRYSSVYSVRHIPTDEYVAIKVIDGLIDQARHQFEVERQILYRYGDENPYMVKAYCSFHQGVCEIDLKILFQRNFFF